MSNPTTSEWTATSLWHLMGQVAIDNRLLDKVLDAHQAALDAERERSLADQPAFRKAIEANIELIEQLAAEREKVQTYEGALIKIANDPNCDRCQVAVDALAKVAK